MAFLCRRYTPAIETESGRHLHFAINREDAVLKPFDAANGADGAEVLFVIATEVGNVDVIRRLQASLKTIATLYAGYDQEGAAQCLVPELDAIHTEGWPRGTGSESEVGA